MPAFNVYRWNRRRRRAVWAWSCEAKSAPHAIKAACEALGDPHGRLYDRFLARLADSDDHAATAIRERLSPQMAHVLTLARDQGADLWRVPLVDGKGSQSRTVGRQNTIATLQHRGLLDADGKLTEAGRLAIATHTAKPKDVFGAVYAAFAADPTLHLRTDLGPHYRAGTLNLRKPSTRLRNQYAAWKAGRDFAANRERTHG